MKYHTGPETPNGKVTEPQGNITQESQEVSHFPAALDHKAAMNRQDSIIKTNVKHTNKKDPQRMHSLGTVSKND